MRAHTTASLRNTPDCIDVAVVGGGPAGSICTLLLAQGGARVALIDRGSVRPSVIELVSGHARRLLESHIGNSVTQAVRGVEVFETVSLWGMPEAVTWSTIYNPWGASMATDRSVFDEALRSVAGNSGVSILAHTKVQGAERTRGGWRLFLHSNGNTCLLYANFLVIATGRTAAHLLNRNSVTHVSQVALMARTNSEYIGTDHTLYLEAVTNGWWYALPDPHGGQFVCFCTGSDKVKRRSRPLHDFWIQELRRTRLIAQILSNAAIIRTLIGCSASLRLADMAAGESWIAVGDAAFAPDPLSGKGIEFGIESAVLGAQLLLSGVRYGARREYDNWIHEYATEHEQIRAFYLSGAVGTV